MVIQPKQIVGDLYLIQFIGNQALCMTSSIPVKANKDFIDTVLTQLNLEDSPASEEQIKELEEVLKRNLGAFSRDQNDLGHTTAVQHEIPLMENSTPFKDRYRRILPAHYHEVRQCLQDMLKGGAIRESHSPYASPIVAVKKKMDLFACVLTIGNSIIKQLKISLALPRIEESLDALSGAQWFSSLDLQKGYWQIEVAKGDK